ncbi:MAG: ATP-dependent DNA helicase RecQ [Myxococcales bacterium]
MDTMATTGTPANDALLDALRRTFGHADFREGQREVVEAVLADRPVIGVMPTGAGKSLCYQLPAVISEGTTVVVSPLIALMKDQVDALVARGVEATFVNSTLTPAERDARMRDAAAGRWRLLYVAPERFRSDPFLDAMGRVRVARVAIDEAHCISQWGHDFRPDYARLGDALRALGLQRVCAFTATATPLVRADIERVLGLTAPDVFVHGFRRANLTLRVVPIKRMPDKLTHIQRLMRTLPGSGIVYVATRKNVEAVAQALIPAGVGVGVYHGGLTDDERTRAQDAFMAGEARVMVATNAFGMGIDKADIRWVVHHDMPGSLEAYYQEAGRAGRDGLPSECAVLFTYADTRIHEFFIDRIGEDRPIGDPDVERLKDMERQKLRRMIAYCYSDRCRHAEILGYFGEHTATTTCDACDNCEAHAGLTTPAWAAAGRAPQRPGRSRGASDAMLTEGRALSEDEAVIVQKLLSAFARANGLASAQVVLRVVRGEDRDVPEALRDSKSFGILRGMKIGTLQPLVAELGRRGILTARARGAMDITPLGREVMWRRADVHLDVPAFGGRVSQRLGASGGGRAGVTLADEGAEDPALFEALRVLRKELAAEEAVPPYVVAHDTVLRRLAASKPTTPDAMLAIKGVGPTSLERYGSRFLDVIRRFVGR